MCEMCRQYPCHPQCPNAEPILYGYCEKCGKQIYAGERICELDVGVAYCEDCISDSWKTAEVY